MRRRTQSHIVAVLVISHERYVPAHVTQGGTPNKGTAELKLLVALHF